jgi:hypothetical protein
MLPARFSGAGVESAVTVATAASPAATTARAASAASTFSGWPGFVQHQFSAVEVPAIQSLNGAFPVGIAHQFDEGKPARLAGEAVTNEIDGVHGETVLLEKITELFFR